jgi:RNA polymerase sigma factor (sigma-70 family)
VGRNADLAADATQATFAQALECLGQFDPRRGDMMTWLRTLARNIIRRLLNQQKRNVQFGNWGHIDETLLRAFEKIDSQPLPEAVLERQETRELVAMTLAALPTHYHQVLEARYLDGQPLDAIAQCRNCTRDGVKSMLRRARAAFRESFLALAKIEASEVEVSDV